MGYSDTRRRGLSLLAALAAVVAGPALAAHAADAPLRIIVFGAHPDDCDETTGGTRRPLGREGPPGQVRRGDERRRRPPVGGRGRPRAAPARGGAGGRRGGFGIAEYEVLDNHDGELEPTLAVRQQIIRRIRQWNADVVIAPRPNDYHPDHRYTGVLVQDTAYMVMVPNVCPDTPPLRKNPVFLYAQDHFQRPEPVPARRRRRHRLRVEKKIRALDAHVSQFYEWLPWVEGVLDTVPKEPAARLAWLRKEWSGRPIADDVRAALRKWYGPGPTR